MAMVARGSMLDAVEDDVASKDILWPPAVDKPHTVTQNDENFDSNWDPNSRAMQCMQSYTYTHTHNLR